MHKALAIAAGVLLAGSVFASSMFDANEAQAAGACSQINAPVCALKKDGGKQTFTNASCAAAEGAKVLHKDSCRWVTCVPWKPVCAIDPTTKKPATYNSMCSAEFYHAVLVSEGKCKGKG